MQELPISLFDDDDDDDLEDSVSVPPVGSILDEDSRLESTRDQVTVEAPKPPKQSKVQRKQAALSAELSLDMFSRRDSSLLLDSIKLVTHQLGYLPCNLIKIGASNALSLGIGSVDYPIVGILYPLNANNLEGRYSLANGLKPFPTIMWMTCPYVHAMVSKLEDQGLISTFQKRLTDGERDGLQYISRMRRAHQLYSEYRWSLLSEEDMTLVSSTPGWEEALLSVGIAGIRNLESVKCLHCHYSHYLCFPEHGNIIGQWVADALADMLADADHQDERKVRQQQEQLAVSVLS